MTLVEEYYELNEAEEVPAIWKILQIAFYGGAAGLGLWCGFTIAVLRVKLGDRCFLLSTPQTVKNETSLMNDEVAWESDAWCDYYQFSLVSSFIVGIIWAAFYLMCGKGGKSVTGLPQPWRIVWPSLFFNLTFFLITLSTSISVQKGTDYFCRINETYETHLHSCTTIAIVLEEKKRDMALFQINAVTRTSWGCAICWLILFLLSSIRILFLVDFRMYKICVFRIDDNIQNKREEVLRITNYEDTRLTYEKVDEGRRFAIDDPEESEMRINALRKVPSRQKLKMRNLKFQSNTAFHHINDRPTSRQNRSRSPRDGLDEDFDRRSSADRRRTFASQGKSGVSEVRPFYRQVAKSVYEDDEELSSSSTDQGLRYRQDFDRKRALTFKKII